jgi:hypothetical protein
LYQPKNQQESQILWPNMDIPELETSKMTKTQKLFEDKKARREQRRSLRESGDFLGVQGANPRTGYWDVSSGTSGSEPSQTSEETKKKLDAEAKNIEEQKHKYEEAKAKHEAELVRVQTLRDNKKKEKEKRKTLELKIKQRRRGKWKLSEDGWRSVAEPELSPIVQSVVGSPARGQFNTLALRVPSLKGHSQSQFLVTGSFLCHLQPIQHHMLILTISDPKTILVTGWCLHLWQENVSAAGQSHIPGLVIILLYHGNQWDHQFVDKIMNLRIPSFILPVLQIQRETYIRLVKPRNGYQSPKWNFQEST